MKFCNLPRGTAPLFYFFLMAIFYLYLNNKPAKLVLLMMWQNTKHRSPKIRVMNKLGVVVK